MLACLDLEGVLLPEIWIAFAEKTGIEKLRLTTRDIPDYDELMRGRLNILDENNLKLADIEDVIHTLSPLDGAKEFLEWLKSEFQVIILSDTFYQFASPLMGKLDYPTLFCHELIIDAEGRIENYRLRQSDGKTKAVSALKGLNFQVIAAGDSYNDTGMLVEADAGILFCPPDNVIEEFPQFPVTRNYEEFKNALLEARASLSG
ncbi:MAG TPA: bifunctional phosphoserine phosphatase/homoserine phosphotransferase ThrH [Nitrospina sp.]|jgi:phosphoserine/homoserine phosphotransferase|nr:bifunctional phosphoserine phosphatase/homoserine phosphotransferase ThrH [Nitrospinota bacterium]MBV51799.1 bifunctional phosphoserine phosphatase/homoserine phosphotransferase ThrH [Nitrospinota bacterium]MDP6336078.1 bifunctional phosphoserine phosphatase/homoserine phosphotransferase ThrH [Nitrospinaceae bacterium]MDP7148909.1 bifunctional phosphoserine phosphatase/homoserine phosphotransferase ThrH [Nitrospinaceae bacterium]HAX46149.1 bifunctional phosphoserine phosphatase/homoserine ph|tara:strand:+ start:2169 stop:2780 length:612 start_codon:yes stop_codon:yes gene_type:complete